MPKIIALYARVSTAKQEEEQTIKSQLDACYEYAKKHDFLIAQEYKDEGWSGDILARPSLDQLRQDATEKKWDAVLFYDPDRLARRYSYQELVMDELKELGIEIFFVTVATPKNNEDKILHGVRGLFAEYERAKISERFRRGKVRKVKEGNILTSEASYGYTYIPKQGHTHGYYIINEEEAKHLRYIFDLSARGLTLKKIVARLHEEGIKPRKSKRGVWSTSTLSTILRSKVYIGEAHWGKSYGTVPLKPHKVKRYKKMKKTSRRIRPESEWYKISVPPLISTELFDKVQQQLTQNAELSKRNRKNNYLLSGKIECVCGVKRAGEGPKNGKYLYYRCANRIYNHPLPRTCHEKGINARIADQLVWKKVTSLMTSPDLLHEQALKWTSTERQRSQETDTRESKFQAEIVKLKTEEDRYAKAYGEGVLSIEQFKEYSQSIKAKVQSLKNKIAKLEAERNEVSSFMPSQEDICQFTECASQEITNLKFEEKRAIIIDVIDRIIGTPRGLVVQGHIPLTSNVAFSTNHRYGRDAIRHDENETIPFEVNIPLPPPLQRGVDYGFRKNVN